MFSLFGMDDFFGPVPHATLGGMKIYVVPDQPRMQLSRRVYEVLTPAMIEDHNQWLTQFFGTTNLVPDGVSYVNGPDKAYMNPRTFHKLRSAVFDAGIPTMVESNVVRLADYRR